MSDPTKLTGIEERRSPGYPAIRTFQSGATRDADTTKPDYEGFLSPLVIREFGKYMHKHRVQSDGALRASDNWQKGIPLDAYLKSLWRHFHDLWSLHRGYKTVDSAGKLVTLKEALTAILFNVQGYLHEVLKQEEAAAVALGAGARTILADPPSPSYHDLLRERRNREMTNLVEMAEWKDIFPTPTCGCRSTRPLTDDEVREIHAKDIAHARETRQRFTAGLDLDACGTTDGTTPMPEWPQFIGEWNLPSGSRPQSPGCWRITANGELHLLRDDGSVLESTFTRDEFVMDIKKGAYVPNTWPIPVRK